MSIHHKKHETRAERKRRIASELRQNHEEVRLALVEASEEGKILLLRPKEFEEDVFPIKPPPPAA